MEQPWRPTALPWEGARLTEDGRAVRLIYQASGNRPADTAAVKRTQGKLVVALSRMERGGSGGRLALFLRCVEVRLPFDASDLELVDGASGVTADKKRSSHLDPDMLKNTARTLDELFEPTDVLTATEFSE